MSDTTGTLAWLHVLATTDAVDNVSLYGSARELLRGRTEERCYAVSANG